MVIVCYTVKKLFMFYNWGIGGPDLEIKLKNFIVFFPDCYETYN